MKLVLAITATVLLAGFAGYFVGRGTGWRAARAALDSWGWI